MAVEKSKYIHHNDIKILANFRELVFGLEDGMVSTLGAVTGIAVGINNSRFIILSGIVIVIVEAISMAIGSYLSTKSIRELNDRKLKEEKSQIEEEINMEKQELFDIYVKDGWPKDFSKEMVQTASKDKKLFFKEMISKELKINIDETKNPARGAVLMLFFYIIGGSLPVIPYFFLEAPSSIVLSIVLTLIGLFILGVITSRFTNRNWLKSGSEVFLLASLAALMGYIIGFSAKVFLGI